MLELGMSRATTSRAANGVDQVGMVGCPLMTKYGVVRCWRTASMASSRKPQILHVCQHALALVVRDSLCLLT
jgi:hypothetical protein